MVKFRVEYDNDTGPSDDGFSEFWMVTNDERSFRVDSSQQDAEWLAGALNAEQAPPAAVSAVDWRAHVEDRIRTWRQSFVNRHGDQLEMLDFMGTESLDDLIDFVCSEQAPPAAVTQWPKADDSDKELGWSWDYKWLESLADATRAAGWDTSMEAIDFVLSRVAAPQALPVAADAWAEGYKQGVQDERTSEASIGICGFGGKVEPARENPYGKAPPAAVPAGGLRDSVLNNAKFRASCYALVGIVEGIAGLGRRWASDGERLKDTPEWVAFYNCVAAMRNGTFNQASAEQAPPAAAVIDRISDERLRAIHLEEQFGLFCDYEEFVSIARHLEALLTRQAPPAAVPAGYVLVKVQHEDRDGFWSFSDNEEDFVGEECDTELDAIAAAFDYYGDDLETVYVGKAKRIDKARLVRGDHIIELIGDAAAEEVGECAYDWPHLSKDECEELERIVMGYVLSKSPAGFFSVENSREYTREQAEEMLAAANKENTNG